MSTNTDTLNCPAIQLPTMSDRELDSFRSLIYAECGISLSQSKKSMVSARLAKRLRALGLKSFHEYYDYVCSPEGCASEITPMIDVITTNTTEFFRESMHFDFLTSRVLPELTHPDRVSNDDTINIWSAGCSSGEEPYTLAMVLAEYFAGETDCFSLLATDISTRVLLKAKRAVYEDDQIANVCALMKRRYLMRGTGSQSGHWRVVPELRNRINFSRMNFMDSQFGLDKQMDVAFCRNVLIYFDQQTKAEVVAKIHSCLAPDGYFFIGHSETLNGISDGFVSVAPTIYRKRN